MSNENNDIQEWLIDDENIVYDTGSYGLTYEKSGGCRGVVTNKRTFFYKKNEKNDISHDLITSISHKTIEIKDTKFLGAAIACFVIGTFSLLMAHWSDVFVNLQYIPYDLHYLIIGIILFVVGGMLLRKRKTMVTQLLEIATASGRTFVSGPEDVLREMMVKIRNNTFDKKTTV